MDIRDSVPIAQNQTTNRPKSKIRLTPLLLAALVLVAVGGGYYFVRQKIADKPDPLAPYSLKFRPGSGFSFDKPTTFKPIAGRLTPFQVIFTNKDKKSDLLGGLMAVSQPVLDKSNPDLDKFNQAIATGNYSTQSGVINSFHGYVSSRLADYKLTFGAPNKFTNANIKSNAIKIDFSGTPKAKGKPVIKGSAVLALSEKTDYSFAVYAIDHKWKVNQSEYQQIINSLKIDQ